MLKTLENRKAKGSVGPLKWDRILTAENVVRRFEKIGSLGKNGGGHRGCVNTVTFSSDGHYLVTGSDDTQVIVWDTGSLRKIHQIDSGHYNNIFSCRFLPETGNNEIVSCGADGLIRHHNIETGASKRLAEHEDACHRLVLDPSSPSSFFSCGEDGLVMVFDTRRPTSKPVSRFRCTAGDMNTLFGIQIHPMEPNYFFVGGDSPTLYLFDRRFVRNSRIGSPYVASFTPPEGECHARQNITGLALNWSGREAIVTLNDGNIFRLDVSGGAGGWGAFGNQQEKKHTGSLQKYVGHKNYQTYKQVNYFGPRSECVVSGSDCGHIFIWDTESAELLNVLKGDSSGAVNCLETHPSLPILATSGLEYDAKIWAPTAPRAIKSLEDVKGWANVPALEIRDQNIAAYARRTREREEARAEGAEISEVSPAMLRRLLHALQNNGVNNEEARRDLIRMVLSGARLHVNTGDTSDSSEGAAMDEDSSSEGEQEERGRNSRSMVIVSGQNSSGSEANVDESSSDGEV